MPLHHSYRLTISKPPQLNTSAKTITPDEGSVRVVEGQNDFRVVNSVNAIVITELQITGSVSTSKEKNNSGANIDIIGLSEDSLAYIQEGSVVILEMGYEDDARLPVIFAGQVQSASVDTEENTTRAKLNLKEGYSPDSVKVSRYYPEGTNYLTILEDLASFYGDNGIPLGRPIGSLASLQGVGVGAPVDSIVLADGFAVYGFLDTTLKRICEEVGFTYYISNARLYIEPKNYEQFTRLYTIPTSNVLSARQSVTNKINIASVDNQETKNVWKIRVFLDGRLESGLFVQLDIPERLSGRFKIINVKHSFDFEGEQWFTDLEVQNA